MRSVNAHGPGQMGRPSVELLVEPVAPPAKALRDRQPWHHDVGSRRHLDALAPAADVNPDRPERDRPGNAETALPDLDRPDRAATLAEVVGPVGEHVIHAAADEPERHRPGGEFTDYALRSAARPPAALRQHDADDDADDDAQRVATDRERTEVPDPVTRTGNVRRHGGNSHEDSTLSASHACGQFGGQSTHTNGLIVGPASVENSAHERRTDNHGVGVTGDLGRLVGVADAEPDAYRQRG